MSMIIINIIENDYMNDNYNNYNNHSKQPQFSKNNLNSKKD